MCAGAVLEHAIPELSRPVIGATLTEPMRSTRRRDPVSQEDVDIVRSIYDAFGRGTSGP